MRNLRKLLPWLCGAAIVAAPAFAGDAAAPAPPLTGAVDAVDFAFEASGSGASSVTIATTGTVTFAYPSGGSGHNVRFTGAQPASCTQTSGPSSGSVPPLPADATGAGWAGTCRFDAAGSYPFVCDAHAFMTGSVVVESPTVPPTPPGGGGPTATATGTPSGSSTPQPGAPGGMAPGSQPTPGTPGAPGAPAAGAVASLRRTQRGSTVRGTITVARTGSNIRVTVVARRSLLGGTGAKRVSVGTYVRSALAGRHRFSVPLRRAARNAISRRGRLPVTVRIIVTPATGVPFSAVRAVTMLPRRQP